MIATAMMIGALLLSAPLAPAQVDEPEAAQWARVIELDGGRAVRATLTPPKYLLEHGFLSPDGEARRPHERRLDGRFIAADADILVLRVIAGGDKGVWRIPRSALAGIEALDVTLDRTHDGYLKGLAVGAGLGLVTYVGFAGSSDAFDVDELPYLMAFYGIPASLLGWLIDNSNRGESFEPVATLYGNGGPQRGGTAGGRAEPRVPAARRLAAGTGVGLGLSGTGRNDVLGPAIALSSIKPFEPKLEFEIQLLASFARGEASIWSGGYYLDDDDEATEVTGRRARRGDDVSALLRINYIVAGERVRPYVSTGLGLGWSRLQTSNVAHLPGGEEFFAHHSSDDGLGLAMLLGGGVDVALGRRWRLRPELTWHGVGWTDSGSFGPAVTVSVTYATGGS